jgi:sirohydrochlorin ferrochelatase
MAAALSARCDFARVEVGFVEEAPFLVDAARGLGQALCLPLFALRAGHVVDDLPEALAAAGFAGPLLPPIGEHAAVPALLAAALRRSVSEAVA